MKPTKCFAILAIAGLLTVILAGATAYAGEAEIKYRQSVMRAIGGHMGAMVMIFKNGGSRSHLKPHAEAMAALSKIAGDVFPDETSEMDGVTAALDAIWEKPKEFAAVIKAFQTEADKLAAIAGSGDMAAIGAQLGALGKRACATCHTNFRAKQQ